MDFAEDYCEEHYPFFLLKEGEAQIKYYRDFKQVLRMQAIATPVIYHKELLQLKQFSFKYKSNTKDLYKLIEVMDEVRKVYKFNDKFLSMKEVEVMLPLFTDFVSYEKSVKESIKIFLKDAISKTEINSEFEEYSSRAEMTFISLYRIVIYGLYTLPIDKKQLNELAEVIKKHEKVEKK